MTDESHVLDSLPAYALGSLDEDEARRVAEHVSTCSRCRDQLTEFEATVGELGFATPAASPSADLKPLLLARVRGQSPTLAEPARGRLPQWLIPAGAAAGLLLIVVLAVSNLLLWGMLNDRAVLSGPLGMRAIALQNTGAAADASGFIVVSADGQNGVLVVDELPVLDPGQEYQLWLERDGQSTSGAVFSVDEDGYRGMRIEGTENLLTYVGARITIEPAGGNTLPEGEEVLGGSLFNP